MSRGKYSLWRWSLALGILLIMWGCGPVGVFPGPDRDDSADALYRQAESQFRSHRYQQALPLYKQYLQFYPQGRDAGRTRLRLAELAGIRGDWAQARSLYEAILTAKPEVGISLRARYGIGQANFKLGNYPAAQQILENLSVSQLPADLGFKANALLTEIALKLRNTAQAFNYLNQAAKEIAPGEEEWFRDLKSRFFEAVGPTELAKFVELHRDSPLMPALLFKLASLEFRAGRQEAGQVWVAKLQQGSRPPPRPPKRNRPGAL